VPIRVDAGKLLAVVEGNNDLPVAMLPPPVIREERFFLA